MAMIILCSWSASSPCITARSTDWQQKINVAREAIELAGTSSIVVDDISTAISENEPRYSFFRYSHEYDGQPQSPVVFVYTCPSSSKIRERMLYASSRAGVIAAAGGEAGLDIAKRVSIERIIYQSTRSVDICSILA